MPFGGALTIGGMALAGGIAGGMGSSKSSTQQRTLAPESALETQAGTVSSDNLKQLQDLVNQGPGSGDVNNSLNSQRSLAAMLQNMMNSGGLPSQQDTNAANQYASQAYQGQQNSLNNTFNDQRIAASRNSARMGRSSIDPVLNNKLYQEQSRQQGQLAADQGSFAAQFAQNLPSQRLNYAQQFAGVQSGLASQAMANRQTLLGLGQQIRSGEQNFRTGNATVTQTDNTPGGFAGFLTGALGGSASGMKAATAFSGGGGTK